MHRTLNYRKKFTKYKIKKQENQLPSKKDKLRIIIYFSITYALAQQQQQQGQLQRQHSDKKQTKLKQSPLQAWTGPEGSRRLRLPDFKTIGT